MLGIAIQIIVLNVAVDGDPFNNGKPSRSVNDPILPFFSIVIVVWGVLMLEYWKRSEKFIALENGMLEFEAQESYRGEFVHDEVINLAGQRVLHFPEAKRARLVFTSLLMTLAMCALVVGTTAAIYAIRNAIAATSANYASAVITSILNAVAIFVYGGLFSLVSKYLTDRENHK